MITTLRMNMMPSEWTFRRIKTQKGNPASTVGGTCDTLPSLVAWVQNFVSYVRSFVTLYQKL